MPVTNPWAPGGARYASAAPPPYAPAPDGGGADAPVNPWVNQYAGEYLAEYGPAPVEVGDEAYLPDFSAGDWANGGAVPDYARKATGIREVYGAPGLQYVPTEEQMLTQQLITLAVVAVAVAAPYALAALAAKGGAAAGAASGASLSAGGAAGSSGGFLAKVGQLAAKIFKGPVGKAVVKGGPKFRALPRTAHGYGLSRVGSGLGRALGAMGRALPKAAVVNAAGEALTPRVSRQQIRDQARQLRQEHARTQPPPSRYSAPSAPADPEPYVRELENQVHRGELTLSRFLNRFRRVAKQTPLQDGKLLNGIVQELLRVDGSRLTSGMELDLNLSELQSSGETLETRLPNEISSGSIPPIGMGLVNPWPNYLTRGVSRALSRFVQGLQELKQSVKQGITDTITTTAEWGYQFYTRVDVLARSNPRVLLEVNRAIDETRAGLELLARNPSPPTIRPRQLRRYLTRDALGRLVQTNPKRLANGIEQEAKTRLQQLEYDTLTRLNGRVIDLNPRTMGWDDLFIAWMFELGPQHFHFDEKAATTQQLFQEDGVKKARQEALEKVKRGDHSPVSHPEEYDVAEYYESLRERNAATIFLGSYTTKVSTTNNGNGTVTLTFEVVNPTSWESGTRFRKAAKLGEAHRGIIPSRKRGGAGIHLGGTMNQTWRWQEIRPLP